MIAELYKNDPSILASDMFDGQIMRKQQFNDKFKKFAEFAYNPKTNFLDKKLMVDMWNANDGLEKIWDEAKTANMPKLKEQLNNLRLKLPKQVNKKIQFTSIELEIDRLHALANNVEELVRQHEKKISND
jgi:hypothetical protein